MERCQLLSEDNAFHLQKMRQARYFRSVNKVGCASWSASTLGALLAAFHNELVECRIDGEGIR